MKSLVYFITFIILSTVLTSCKDIIAEDITGDTPVLIIPTLNDTVMTNPVQFKWEPMEGATKYRLEVVSPSFSNISEFVLDTIITTTTFSFPLDSNQFELRLTAMNAGYTSQVLGPIKFWVGISPNVSSTSVTLTSPSDGLFVNPNYVDSTFSWQTLSGASSYEFALRKGSSFGTGSIEDTQNNIVAGGCIISNSVTLSEGTYFWGVKAYTTSGETLFSTRSFKVDVTDPNTPTLTSPTNMSFLSPGVIDFIWSNGTDGGTIHAPVHSFIEISSDSGFSTIVESLDLTGFSTSFNLSSGTYYWRVHNYDEAANVSLYSVTNTITVN